MSKVVGTSVAGLTAVAVLGVAVASTEKLGEFTTRVAEDRLFTADGRILRCDLFFSQPGAGTAIVPKGSEIVQSIPPVVWQYSGLLPVSDYMKTVALHGVFSEDKIRPWQEVQKFFYSGLRAEGANVADAKVAYAGAYAFAPRWPLVQFIEIQEDRILGDASVLYDVEYIEPPKKGLSFADYQMLAMQILDEAEDISLDDIKSVIDAADSAKVSAVERASLGGIGGDEPSLATSASDIPTTDQSATTTRLAPDELFFADKASDSAEAQTTTSSAGIKTSGDSILMHSGEQMVNKSSDDLIVKSENDLAVSTDSLPGELVQDELAEVVSEEAQIAIPDVDQPLPVSELFYDDLKDQSLDSELVGAEIAADESTIPVVETMPAADNQAQPLPVNELFYDDGVVAQPQLPNQSGPVESGPVESGLVESGPDQSMVDGELVQLGDTTSEVGVMAEIVTEPVAEVTGTNTIKPLPIDELFIDDISDHPEKALASLEEGDDEWVLLPDGTLVLKSVEKLVQQ